MIEENATLARATSLMSSAVEGNLVILNIENGLYHSLNPMASWIWMQLESPIQVSRILEALINEYAVERAQAATDLIAVLERFHEQGLITAIPYPVDHRAGI